MRLLSALLVLALVPAAVDAQGRMGGMGGMGGMGSMGGRNDQRARAGLPKFATAKELERFNAADAVLTEARKLKLTEEQVTQLTTLRATLFEQNARLLVRYDSVRRDFKVPKALDGTPSGASAEPPSREELTALSDQMKVMMDVADELVARRPEQVAACLALLDDSQKGRATDVLKDQGGELRKQVPERPKRK